MFGREDGAKTCLWLMRGIPAMGCASDETMDESLKSFSLAKKPGKPPNLNLVTAG